MQVKLPRGKTYIRKAVDVILAQGRLGGELRVDEAGTPFYWVTQFTKDSPRAVKLDAPAAKAPPTRADGSNRDLNGVAA